MSGSHWAKIKVSAGPCSFLEALGKDLFSCLFRFPVAAYILGLLPLSIFKDFSLVKSLLNDVTLTLTLLISSSTFKDPGITSGTST